MEWHFRQSDFTDKGEVEMRRDSKELIFKGKEFQPKKIESVKSLRKNEERKKWQMALLGVREGNTMRTSIWVREGRSHRAQNPHSEEDGELLRDGADRHDIIHFSCKQKRKDPSNSWCHSA